MNKKLIIGVGVGLMLLIAIGFTYAFFAATVTGNENAQDQIVETGTLSLLYNGGPEISLGSVYPGDSISKVFTVTNTGTLDTEYSINFTNLINTITNEELVVSYTCTSYTDYVDENNKGTETGTCAGITNQPVEETEESISSIITNNIPITSGITHEYTLTITFIETNEAQDYNQGKTFSATINVGEKSNVRNIPLLSAITEDNEVQSDAHINFAYTSEGKDNSGTILQEQVTNGLYKTSDLTKTEDINGDGTGEEVLYFRGEVENNYLVFAGFCWRIVRTNEDGSIKLRYGGEPDSNGYCPQTGIEVKINNENYAFNTSNEAAKYIGYIYDTNTSSTAKSTIDTWYANNIANKGISVTSLIVDTPYCNDTTVATTTSITTFYGAHERLFISSPTPQYKCPQATDKYTVNTDNGNGKLTYPIALLTADEVEYAGSLWNTANSTYYLYIGANYWTMSPASFVTLDNFVPYVNVVNVNFLGHFNDASKGNYTYGLLPAISLTQEAEVTQGTGLYNDPYVIG